LKFAAAIRNETNLRLRMDRHSAFITVRPIDSNANSNWGFRPHISSLRGVPDDDAFSDAA